MKKNLIAVDADDSSDEEDITGCNEAFDLHEQYKKFLSEEIPEYIRESDGEGYSFLAHAIGTQILYSPQVSHPYYLKKQSLTETTVIFDNKKRMEDWLVATAFRTISIVFEHPLQIKLTQQLTHKFLQTNVLNEKIMECSEQDPRSFFKQLHCDDLQKVAKDLVEFIKEQLYQFVNSLDPKQNFDPPPLFNLDDFSANLLAYIETFLKKKKIIRENGKFQTAKNWPSVKSSNPVKKLILEESKKYNGNQTISHLTTETQKRIFEAILTQELAHDDQSIILKLENGRYRLKKSVTAESLENSGIYFLFNPSVKRKYLPMNCGRLKSFLIGEIKRSFDATFLAQLKENKKRLGVKLNRGLLPQQYQFTAQSVTDFLANIRVNSRNQRRRIRQAREDEERQEIDGEVFQAAWQLPKQKHLALETQEISSKGSRSDQVVNLETYGRINNTLQAHKQKINPSLDKQNNLKLNDKIIARWLRDILINGVPKTSFNKQEGKKLCFDDIPQHLRVSFLKFLINLCYLLFGCEIQRNPASLITHQMMLDLIILNQLTWTQALSHTDYEEKYGGGDMPMSMGAYKKEDNKKATAHPVPCARLLQKYYGMFAVKPWHYDGEEASESKNNIQHEHTKELISRENKLVKKWLNAKNLDKKSIDEQISIIEETALEWYQIPKNT